jgi:hypothetical protein
VTFAALAYVANVLAIGLPIALYFGQRDRYDVRDKAKQRAGGDDVD